jgi:protein-S-isoprenylcysteine O-methyltransferase Ste14
MTGQPMLSENAGLALLLVAWLVYFALHSALASLRAKTWMATRHPGLMPLYRLAFNSIASLGLLPIVWLLYSHPGPLVWAWSGPWAWLGNGLALAAVAGFFHTLRDYDLGEFLGTRQWRNQTRSVEDQESLHLSPAHRFVRHPWYFFSLMILWTRDMSAALLITALVITAYFVVGSRLEEKKLIAYHGERYRRYMRKVAGLVPLPWKTISKAEAIALVSGKD